MDTPTLTRTQRRAAEMRRTLIDIAEDLLIEGGVAAVTAEEVARRADVSLQTVYNRIGRKPALLMAIAERAMEENHAFIDEAYSASGTAEERALSVFNAYVRFAFERPQQFRILANPPDEPEAIERIASMARQQNAKLESIIRDGIAAGDFHADLEPESAANALWAMMDGVLCLALRSDAMRPNNVDPENLVRETWKVLARGMQAR
ncbi:TetR/AcrR family transcriptional regulator [Burkholderia ambifaria]|uniref:TetR/AcrR family transcriptional regulator n=1 Tax=Burkholderia ambifaria TaxID=152480 RepID=UPI0015899937|nr:TetR/AcrR family transcriptional regulator [Burkholderia ambifaria]